MLNRTHEFDKLISQNSKVSIKATLTFADGTILNLEGDDFMEGGVSFTDSVSSTGSFDVGAAIIGQCTVTLNNYDDRFSTYDFTDAKIEPYVGVVLSNGTTEWLKKGVFWIEQPSAYPAIISLTAFDNMSKFERDYTEVDTTVFPATLRSIVMDICTKYGITIFDTNFANYDYVVENKPEDGALTCLNVIAAAAQCSGNWARMDNYGRLVFDWYDTSIFEDERPSDGGSFDMSTPHTSGDSFDAGYFDTELVHYQYGESLSGGTFTTDDTSNVSGGDFSGEEEHYDTGADIFCGELESYNGDDIDAGQFTDSSIAVIYGVSTSTIFTDDVVITGLQVTALDGEIDNETIDGEVELYGTEGYVLHIEDNPLIAYGKAADVAQRVGQRVIGMRFRPFDISAIGNPAYEAGDPIIIIDAKCNTCQSYITYLNYKAGSYEAFSCSAETPSRNKAIKYSSETKNIVELRNRIKREETTRSAALKNLATQLAANTGFFITVETMDNGGSVYYMHNKPTLAESQYVWKLTADAFAISTDGGETYDYGIDVHGNAILERIYAVGVDASYITTGSLEVKRGQKTLLKVDCDTGRLSWNSTYSSMTPEGEITCTKGNIGNFTITENELYNDYIRLVYNGVEFTTTTGVMVGHLGAATTYNGTRCGVTINLDSDADFISWARQNSLGTNQYYDILRYEKEHTIVTSTSGSEVTTTTEEEALHAGCNLNMHFKTIRSATLDENCGVTGGITKKSANFILPTQLNSSGAVTEYKSGCYLNFRRGFLIGASLP